jgi:hypothetical protein
MDQILSSVAAEVERIVKPLGFSIKEVIHTESKSLIGNEYSTDNEELSIIVVRKGKLG